MIERIADHADDVAVVPLVAAADIVGLPDATALQDDRVRRLDVIDALPAVIGWHERELLPVSAQLVNDSRTTLVHADFFAAVREAPAADDARYDVILLDVDHSPRHTLDPSHADLYTTAGLESLARHLTERGVFALWSDDPPDADFMATVQGTPGRDALPRFVQRYGLTDALDVIAADYRRHLAEVVAARAVERAGEGS